MRDEGIYNQKEKRYNILAKIASLLVLVLIAREALLIFLTLLLPFVFGENAWLSLLVVPFVAFVIWGIFPVCKVLWRMLR